MKKETTIQLEILKYLKGKGYYCWRNNNGAVYDSKLGGYRSNPYTKKGVPDILGVMQDGRFFGIEVKTQKGRQSPEQAIFEKRIKELGGVYVLARSVDDVVSIFV